MSARPVGLKITHTLGEMAAEVGIFYHLWRPEEMGIYQARQLIEPLERGLLALQRNRDRFMQYETPNGWRRYDQLVDFIAAYVAACRANPDAVVTSRQ